MRQSTPLLQLHALQTCLFLSVQLDGASVTFQQGGHKTMACLSGKGHGKKKIYIFCVYSLVTDEQVIYSILNVDILIRPQN